MRLLLAEDELDLAKEIQAILKHHHYDVDHVANDYEIGRASCRERV